MTTRQELDAAIAYEFPPTWVIWGPEVWAMRAKIEALQAKLRRETA